MLYTNCKEKGTMLKHSSHTSRFKGGDKFKVD